MYYNMSLTKYEYLVNKSKLERSDERFYDWLREVGLVEMKKLDDFNPTYESQIITLKLINRAFYDELMWDDGNKKSLRSVIVNNLNDIIDRLECFN